MTEPIAIPLKRMRELEDRVALMLQTVPLGVDIIERHGKGRRMRIGGVWSMRHRRYIAPLPEDWKPRRAFEAGPNQYDLLLDFLDAMHNDERARNGEQIIQDIIAHGGRRSGKSSVLAPAAVIAMIMWPGSVGLIMAPLKRHGDRIVAKIRAVLEPETWQYDKRDNTFKLINTSFMYSRNVNNFDNEIGEGLRFLFLDEAATFKEEVYSTLAPSLYDHNGVCCMSTTPRKLNWVYQKVMQARSGFSGIRAHAYPLDANVFLSDAAKIRAKQAAMTLSQTAYRQEIMGEFIPEAGLAFGEFNDDNVRSWHDMPDDATPALTHSIWGDAYQFVASVDFNFEPTIGTICKFDSLGRPWIVREIIAHGGATDRWGQLLADTLRELGVEDPTRDCVIIADATGDFQGTGPNAGQLPGTWKTLQAQGWQLYTPTGKRRRNPDRKTRLELTRSLIHNVKNERRLFVDPDCQATIDMFRGLPVKNGMPDRTSQHIHSYDGATYGPFRVWGTSAGYDYFGFRLVAGLED